MRTTKYKELLILLNNVWGLEGFHSFLAQRINRRARLGFGGTTVLSASSGDQVSCYTTVGDQMLNYQLIGLEEPQVSHLH
jgi:hypothetical protein